ncbi:helix-turn-helix transcriptional regulator [Ideonella sp.]|uniref:helix-turn-helix transcriptional regulator n=1 Tax=Ideonella sp. TaxID=1929293 RepID=UPI003BB59B7B
MHHTTPPGAGKKAHQNFDQLPDAAHVRASELLSNILPVGRTTLFRWVREGRWPKPVKLGPKVTAWRVGDVRAALAAQA